MVHKILTFGPQDIQPKATVTVQMQPGCLFRGLKITNTGDADDLVVSGLFVGEKPQLYDLWELPVSDFCAEMARRSLQMDTCDPALFITWQVKNTGNILRTWSATIKGITVDTKSGFGCKLPI